MGPSIHITVHIIPYNIYCNLRKPNIKISVLLAFFLSSFSPSHITQKLYRVYKYYTYQRIDLLMNIIPTCLELHVNHDWQAKGCSSMAVFQWLFYSLNPKTL